MKTQIATALLIVLGVSAAPSPEEKKKTDSTKSNSFLGPYWIAPDYQPSYKDRPGPEHSGESRANRIPRGVNLGKLRRLVNNVALSEYYRLRGIEALGTLGLGGLSPIRPSAGGGASVDPGENDPNRSKIFQRIFDSYRKDKTLSNIFGFLSDAK